MILNPTLLTLAAFILSGSSTYGDTNGLAPDKVAYLAFGEDLETIAFSDEHGQNPDASFKEVIGVDVVPTNFIPDGLNIEKVFLARVQTGLITDIETATKLGQALEAYTDRYNNTRFSTGAVSTMKTGGALHNKWTTVVLCKNGDNTWTFKDIGQISVEVTHKTSAIMHNSRVFRTPTTQLLQTLLLDNTALTTIVANTGFDTGEVDGFLVRTPGQTAFTVVGSEAQAVYNDANTIVATSLGSTDGGYIVLPAIDVSGMQVSGQATTVGFEGDRTNIQFVPTSTLAPNFDKVYNEA
jgi:hypothetical protein